jgi:CheY-like chemotaxis protein
MKKTERRAEPAGPRASGAAGRGQRVLVVDDEPDIRELLELTLAKMGLAVDSAGSLEEARRYLQEANYQLCLTDMRLPMARAWSWCATSPASAATCRWPSSPPMAAPRTRSPP